MRKKQYNIVPGIFCFLVLFCAGCTFWSKAVQLDANAVEFYSKSLPGFDIRGLEAWQDGDQLLVKGRIRREDYENTPRNTGHIDISVKNPSGTVLAQASAHHSPRVVPYINRRSSNFAVLFSIVLPEGSIIEVLQRDGPRHEMGSNVEAVEPEGFLFNRPIGRQPLSH